MRWLFFLLILSESISASHFDGGTIRWTPVSKNVTTSPVQIMITQTYTYTLSLVTCTVGSLIGTTIYGYNFNLWCTLNCGATSAGYVAPPILGYCTGSSPGLNIAFAQRTDIVNLTANDYFSISYAIPNTASQGYYRPLTLSSGANDTTAQWNITASIDIRSRADNGLINTPPLANVMSPYGIPYNVTTQIVIPTMDVDGDDVRCRWGNSSLECGDVCFPQTMPASTTLSSNCILTITGTSTSGWYCAAIQVEDFLNTSTSLQPLSSTAVQFLIYVYKSKNCSTPTLLGPSTCLGVRVGFQSVLTLTAINSCGSSSNISDIAVQPFTGIVEGPLVQVTPNKTVYAMNITYTPLASQVGLQILCATALDNTNIPSNQYCVTFIVGTTVTPTCPGVTSTTFQTSTPMITTESVTTQSQTSTSKILTTNAESTSVAAVTNSSSAMILSTGNLQTSETSRIETISQTEIISSDTTPRSSASSITSMSKPNSINWTLIGSLVGLISLLALLGSCCFCYHYLWSTAARRRRRRRQQQEDKHRRRYKPVSDSVTNSPTISRPTKAYQVYDIDTDRTKSSNSNNKTCQRTKLSSSATTNVIRPETREKSITSANIISDDNPCKKTYNSIPLRPLSKANEDDHPTANSTDNTNQNRAKTTVSVTRVLNTKRYKSMSNERNRKRSSHSNILVTRIKNNVH